MPVIPTTGNHAPFLSFRNLLISDKLSFGFFQRINFLYQQPVYCHNMVLGWPFIMFLNKIDLSGRNKFLASDLFGRDSCLAKFYRNTMLNKQGQANEHQSREVIPKQVTSMFTIPFASKLRHSRKRVELFFFLGGGILFVCFYSLRACHPAPK